jgi:hypothetical protein
MECKSVVTSFERLINPKQCCSRPWAVAGANDGDLYRRIDSSATARTHKVSMAAKLRTRRTFFKIRCFEHSHMFLSLMADLHSLPGSRGSQSTPLT